jgi:hypothetical protein
MKLLGVDGRVDHVIQIGSGLRPIIIVNMNLVSVSFKR